MPTLSATSRMSQEAEISKRILAKGRGFAEGPPLGRASDCGIPPRGGSCVRDRGSYKEVLREGPCSPGAAVEGLALGPERCPIRVARCRGRGKGIIARGRGWLLRAEA